MSNPFDFYSLALSIMFLFPIYFQQNRTDHSQSVTNKYNNVIEEIQVCTDCSLFSRVQLCQCIRYLLKLFTSYIINSNSIFDERICSSNCFGLFSGIYIKTKLVLLRIELQYFAIYQITTKKYKKNKGEVCEITQIKKQ